MAKKWSEVVQSEAYKALVPEKQVKAQQLYFDEVVAPQVPEAKRDTARTLFYQDFPLSTVGAEAQSASQAVEQPKPEATPESEPKPKLVSEPTPEAAQGESLTAPQPEKADAPDAAKRLDALAKQVKEENKGRFEATDVDAIPKNTFDTIVDSVTDLFTGSDRETKATQELPTVLNSGMFADLGGVDIAKIATAYAAGASDEQLVQVFKSIDDGIGVAQDEKGNFIINRNGRLGIVNKPGIDAQDIGGFIGSSALFVSPAGKAATLSQTALREAIAAGSSELARQGILSGVGAEADIENAAYATLFGGALPIAGEKVLKPLAEKAKNTVGDIKQQVGTVLDSVRDKDPDAKIDAVIDKVKDAATAKTDKKQAKKTDVLAETSAPQTEVLDAAERLGVKDDLLTSHVSDNPEYRQVEQALKSTPGSLIDQEERKTIQALSAQADKLITDFSGSLDKSALSEELKTRLITTIDDLSKQSSTLYNEITQEVGGNVSVNTRAIREGLADEIKAQRGVANLEPIERRIYQMATGPDVSYSRLDKERKKLGDALFKKQGVYKDQNSFVLGRLYDLVTQAQGDTLKTASLFTEQSLYNKWNTAKGLVKQRKALEADSINLLGKDLAGAIMPKAGGAIKKLQGGDYADFDRLMERIPAESRQQVMVSALNDAFSGGNRNTALDIPQFVNWYDGVKANKGTLRRIKKYLPEGAAERLQDLYTVSKAVKTARQDYVPTGRLKEFNDKFAEEGGFTSRLYGLVAPVATAVASSAVGAPLVLVGENVLGRLMNKSTKSERIAAADKLLASREFRELARDVGTGNIERGMIMNRNERKLTSSKAFKKLYNLLDESEKRALTTNGAVNYFFPVATETQQSEPKPVPEP